MTSEYNKTNEKSRVKMILGTGINLVSTIVDTDPVKLEVRDDNLRTLLFSIKADSQKEARDEVKRLVAIARTIKNEKDLSIKPIKKRKFTMIGTENGTGIINVTVKLSIVQVMMLMTTWNDIAAEHFKNNTVEKGEPMDRMNNFFNKIGEVINVGDAGEELFSE